MYNKWWGMVPWFRVLIDSRMMPIDHNRDFMFIHRVDSRDIPLSEIECSQC